MSVPTELGSPQYHVAVVSKGKQRELITDRVNKLSHTDSSKDTPKLEITVDNSQDFVLTHPDLMRKGAVLEVGYGYPGLMRTDLRFTIKSHKGNDRQITIEALELKQSRMARKDAIRVYQNQRRSDVVREVMSRNGIPVDQQLVDDTELVLPTITQTENDWTFLARLASLEGFEFYSDTDGLHWHKPTRSKRPTHLMRYQRNFYGIGVISEYSIESFGAGVPGRVVFRGRDPLTKRRFEVVADAANTADVQPLGEADMRTPAEGDQQNLGNDGFELVKNVGSRSEGEAKKLADSVYKDYRYNALKLSCTTAGDPTLRKGNTVVLWGLGKALDGTYYCKEVTHTFDATYSCKLNLTRDGANKPNSRAADMELERLLNEAEGAGPDWSKIKARAGSGRGGRITTNVESGFLSGVPGEPTEGGGGQGGVP